MIYTAVSTRNVSSGKESEFMVWGSASGRRKILRIETRDSHASIDLQPAIRRNPEHLSALGKLLRAKART